MNLWYELHIIVNKLLIWTSHDKSMNLWYDLIWTSYNSQWISNMIWYELHMIVKNPCTQLSFAPLDIFLAWISSSFPLHPTLFHFFFLWSFLPFALPSFLFSLLSFLCSFYSSLWREAQSAFTCSFSSSLFPCPSQREGYLEKEGYLKRRSNEKRRCLASSL